MKSLKLKNDFYWVGALDKDLRVFDIIMETEFGTTYNSYLLKTKDKIVLFETVKVKFFDEYLESLKEIVDINKIDYIVVSHTEPDHAGSIEKLVELNPNIKVVGSSVALNFLRDIINSDFYSLTVSENDILEVGDKTLKFMSVPNLHWPDTIYTYIEEDNILITCDSFGSHYSFEDVLLSKVTDNEGYMRATKYYFDNIIGPFKSYMLQALDKIEGLELDLICTGHGPVIDCRIDEIKEIYKNWCTVVNPNPRKTVIIPYVSAYGYTKELAYEIEKGIKDSGDIDVRSYDLVETDTDTVLGELGFADGILLGSPTIVGEALKPIWDLTTSIFAGTHGGKLASAFGSYGWSGEAVPHLIERLKQLQMDVVDGFRVKFKPGKRDLKDAYQYGYNFGCTLLNKENKRNKNNQMKVTALVKCVVCGEIFDASLDICPVCGVGREYFIPVYEEENNYSKDTEEKFVILGNGAAGVNAAKAIRDRNKTCSIVMISNEDALSYNRPMLTKSMIANFDASQLAIYDEKWYKENNIINVLGKEIIKIDAENKVIILEGNMEFKYDKCIYALGSECFVPPIPGHEKEGVVAIRRATDTAKVNKLLQTAKNAVVIGGGVLGLEAAWELRKAKCNVTVLELAPTLMSRQLDTKAGEFLEKIIREAGLDLRLNVKIESIEGNERVSGVKLGDGEIIPAEIVIISCGVKANTKLATDCGISVGRSVVVNNKMETNIHDIYACGDCAEFENINYGIWPQAVEMGKVAGANAAGDSLEYETVSAGLTFNGMNTSLFAIGDVGKDPNKRYKTVEFVDDDRQDYEKYYFVNGRLTGVILIGDTSKLVEMTTAVEENRQFKDIF